MAGPDTLRRARALRANQTASEARLWGALRGRRLGGWKWRRQAPIGPFVADFFCPALGLVVELDGSDHLDAVDYDERRTRYLGQRGVRVIRFPSEWALENLDGLCEAILSACGGESPHRSERSASGSPLPLKRERVTFVRTRRTRLTTLPERAGGDAAAD
jgi:very-short-patch-repair endonuclease